MPPRTARSWKTPLSPATAASDQLPDGVTDDLLVADQLGRNPFHVEELNDRIGVSSLLPAPVAWSRSSWAADIPNAWPSGPSASRFQDPIHDRAHLHIFRVIVRELRKRAGRNLLMARPRPAAGS